MNVSPQTNAHDCGVYATAYSTDLAHGADPVIFGMWGRCVGTCSTVWNLATHQPKAHPLRHQSVQVIYILPVGLYLTRQKA